jgi:DNA repair exonuclease SbcCD ATPase subunit
MNNDQRKQLKEQVTEFNNTATELINRLEAADSLETLEEQQNLVSEIHDAVEGFKDQVTALKDEEQEKLDNMGEALRAGPRGEGIQEAVDTLETAEQELDEVISACDDFNFDEPDWSNIDLNAATETAQGLVGSV